MEGDAADELDVEMHHFPGLLMVADDGGGTAEAAGGVLDDREGLGEEGVEVLSLGEAGLELGGLRAEGFVREFLILDFERVDPLDEGSALTEELPVVTAREELEDAEKHGVRERKEANSEPTPRGKPSLGLFTSDFPPCGCAPTPKM
jgi:hypothetical protein